MLREFIDGARRAPTSGDDLADWKSIVRIVNRRRQELGKRLCSEAAAQRVPARDSAGHGDRIDAATRHSRHAFGSQELRVQPGGSPSAGIEAVELACLRFIINNEQIAADSVHGRLHQPDRCVGRDRRINGIAATLEHLDAGARRQRMARRYNAQLCRNHGPPNHRTRLRL